VSCANKRQKSNQEFEFFAAEGDAQGSLRSVGSRGLKKKRRGRR